MRLHPRLSTAFFIWWQFIAGSARARHRPRRSRPWRYQRSAEPGASGCAASLPRVLPTPVRELDLELDAFEGPFDLLLTLLLKEELEPRDIDIAAIVLAFVERLAARDELDLEACGEFLVLVSALLELKARALFPDEAAELEELEPEEAAEELARRLAEYRRMKEAAAWLLGAARRRARPLLPARAGAARAPAGADARAPGAGLSSQRPCARSRRRLPRSRSRTWRCASRRSRSSSSASARCSRTRRVFDFDSEVDGLSRVEQAVALPRAARAAQGRRDRARARRPRSPR